MVLKIIFKNPIQKCQYDQGSQDPDPGLQEKSMNPFCISFGKTCTISPVLNTTYQTLNTIKAKFPDTVCVIEERKGGAL